MVKEKIDAFRDFGGVRIEDDCVIHDDHVEIMSKVPRTVEEIEAWMSGQGGDIPSVLDFEKALTAGV